MTETTEQRRRYLEKIRADEHKKRKIKRRESRILGFIWILVAVYVAIVLFSAVTFAVFIRETM